MAQTRIWNFGDTLTHRKISIVNEKLFSHGVYEGYDVHIVDPQTLELYDVSDPSGAVGYLLLPDGVILSESSPVQFQFTVLPALETIYTIVARHTQVDQFGGAAATYDLLDGYVAMGGVSDGTVIAWIYHPGMGAPLSDYMIVQPPKMKVQPYATYKTTHDPVGVQGYSSSFLVDNDLHHIVTTEKTDLSPLQSGTSWVCRQIYGDGGTPAPAPTTSLLAQFQCAARPTKVEIVAYLETGCDLAVELYDTEDALALSTPNSFTPLPTPAWQELTVTVPPYKFVAPDYVANGTWTVDNLWRIDLKFAVAQLRTCKLAQVTVHYE